MHAYASAIHPGKAKHTVVITCSGNNMHVNFLDIYTDDTHLGQHAAVVCRSSALIHV